MFNVIADVFHIWALGSGLKVKRDLAPVWTCELSVFYLQCAFHTLLLLVLPEDTAWGSHISSCISLRLCSLGLWRFMATSTVFLLGLSLESWNNLWLNLPEAHLNLCGRCSIAFSSHTQTCPPSDLWLCGWVCSIPSSTAAEYNHNRECDVSGFTRGAWWMHWDNPGFPK